MSCEGERVGDGQVTGFDDLGARDRELALEHLKTCAACRRESLGADPSLLFNLGLERSSAGLSSASEARSMRSSVAALRLAEQLRKARPAPTARIRGAVATVVAVLFAAALFVSHGAGRPAAPSAAAAVSPELLVDSPFAELVSGPGHPELSVIEEVDLPGARVYQLTEDDLSLVMIVDETLEL